MRDHRLRLDDMLTAIDNMLGKTVAGRIAFEEDEMLQVWMVHHLEILGEAASALPPSLRAAHPQVPWHRIIGARNHLAHGYFAVDIGVVWEAVEHELPTLRGHVAQMLSDLEEKGAGS